MSISKWFGGVDSSSDEEDEEGATSGVPGDETPRFTGGGLFDGSALIDEPDSAPEGELDDDDEDDEEGVIPIPGGERVSRATINAGAAAGPSQDRV